MSTAISYGPGSGGVGQSNLSLAASFVFSEATGSPFNYDLKNVNSPLRIDKVDLTTGANTITAPTAPMLPGGVVIIPPAANASSLTLKGVTGDTGVALSPTVPTYLAFPATPPTTFCLTAGGNITGLQLVWL